MLRQQHLPLPPNVLFSSRRRRRPQSYSGQTRIPDWVWGAGLGLVVVIFIGGYFVLSSVAGSGGGSECDKALPSIGNSTINQQTINDEMVGLARVIDMLDAGDRNGAEQAFYGPVHNFTHSFDPPLREQDEGAAKVLCKEVRNAETLLDQVGPNDQIARSLTLIRNHIADGAVTLGYERPRVEKRQTLVATVSRRISAG